SMIGAGLPSSRLEHFKQGIEAGKVLMMVDVPKDRVEEIEERVRKHHPDVNIGGTEPTIPPFP
ncbi:MAG: DUF1269 domain-containing protein, partial [Gammaproteobacteria bacterium]